MSDLAKQYQKHTLREHIYKLPDTYIGSIENSMEEHYIVENNKFILKNLLFNPGFYKLIDELLVNAHDHVIRLKEKKSSNLVKNIDISCDGESFTIRNDGESIDIEKHPEHGIYIPQLIFGELLTSTNYDEKEQKLVGGKNGYGVKLVNIFSKKFKLCIVDTTRKLKYEQIFENNMTKINEPIIKPCKTTKSYIEITFEPDFKKFGWTNKIPQDLLSVIQRRVYDLAMTVNKEVRVTWCDTLIKFRDLTSYTSWYLPEDALVITDNPQLHWHIAICDSPTDKFFSVSFVNGIWTRSGKHVDEITNQIVSHFTSYIESKKKIKVKPSLIKDSLGIFINCLVVNPSFSSQTKEILTSKVSCKLSEDFLKKLLKLNILDKVLEEQQKKDSKEDKKTDGKKQTRITGIPKLDDALNAGTSKSHECTLILTEGDSAKAMALSGLSQEQRKSYGIFPLKGKLLNVKDTSTKKVEQTDEIANLKKIIGLESGKKYKDLKSLRYGKILIMTDQDFDGAHIRGLLINVFHELWHELITLKGFITYMATPIVKATRNTKTLSFYTQYEYEQWKKTNPNWKIKYYKGLGTSTRDEAKEYFKAMNVVEYEYIDKKDDESIELAFNKSMADQRKEWLKLHDESNIVVNTSNKVRYEDFVNKDLIHFSNYNLERSIPNMMDGLKTSQRKILFSAFKRNLKAEIRVAQFAGYVSEHSGYHHGEASLNDTIVGMAQDFVGSNNVSWFVPQGQFGTRLQGGKDSASPRYIHTYLQPNISQLIPKEDFDSLDYRDDDGLLVEPYWYCPILPMLLINGARGIGTGYSTFIPPCNPHKILEGLRKFLKNQISLKDIELKPYYKNFKGIISDDLSIKGLWTISKDIMEITELPIEVWTNDYKEYLCNLEQQGTIKEFFDSSTDTIINIKIKLTGNPDHLKILEKSLEYKLKLTNMHAFNSKCVIQKYNTFHEILEEFVSMRFQMYEKRKELQLKNMREKIPYHENVVRFIKQQVLDKPIPDLRRKSIDDCIELLRKDKFIEINESYDYLLNLPYKSISLTNMNKHISDLESLIKEIQKLECLSKEELWYNDLELFHINK
jgi:DNA topoisomerase-2